MEEPKKKDFNPAFVLAEFAKRKKYPVLDSEVIASLDDEDLLQAIYDYVELNVDLKDEISVYKEFKKLPIGTQYLFAIYYYELATESDGLNCFFEYIYGLFSEELLQGLAAIGANATVLFVNKVIESEFGSLAYFKEKRERYFEYAGKRKINDKLFELEQEYQYQKDYSDLVLIKYVRSNISLFIKMPT